MYFMHTQKNSCYAEHSSLYEFKTAIFNVGSNRVFFHILLKKKSWILILHESLDVRISHNSPLRYKNCAYIVYRLMHKMPVLYNVKFYSDVAGAANGETFKHVQKQLTEIMTVLH